MSQNNGSAFSSARIAISLLALSAVFTTPTKANAEVVFQQIYEFPKAAPAPYLPATRLVEGVDGCFYGTTLYGGSNNLGTIFKVTCSGTLTTLLSFTGTNGQCPFGGLVLGKDGNFYGTTAGNGGTDFGRVFKMTAGGVLTNLVSFNGANGSRPNGQLVQGLDGNFYGTTLYGGEFGLGKIFSVSTNGVLTTLFSFSGTNGCNSSAGLVGGPEGSFYGVTPFGGGNYNGAFTGNGTVFRITSNGELTTLVIFNGTNGIRPMGALARGFDGNFYGTTVGGGVNGGGTFFCLTPDNVLTSLCNFGPSGPVAPYGGVTQGRDGNFYGTTAYRIVDSNMTNGTVYKVTTNGVLTTLINLNGTNGLHPFTEMVLGRDGNLYGAMADITKNITVNGGTLYRLVPLPVITRIVSTNGNTTLTWSSFSNALYRVQWNPPLSDTNWTTRPFILTAQGSNSSFAEPWTGPSGYYRVVWLP